MSEYKKKKHFEEQEESHHGDEPWLVSYADLMTLLFGFFVLMYSFASKNTSTAEFDSARKEISKYFGNNFITMGETVMTEVKPILEKSPLKANYDIKEVYAGLEVTMRSGALFEAGSADLVGSVRPTIDDLIKFLLSKKDTILVEVEGHTDSSPISGRYPSNWELSGARASTVIRMFIEKGFPGSSIYGINYADQRPLAPELDKSGKKILENQAKNRRVVIRILTKGAVEKKAADSHTK
jgi:chemotaxis protein MotB